MIEDALASSGPSFPPLSSPPPSLSPSPPPPPLPTGTPPRGDAGDVVGGGVPAGIDAVAEQRV